MVAINLDASSSSRLPTTTMTMMSSPRKYKMGKKRSSPRSVWAFLCVFLCVNLTGGLMVLFLEKFAFISWGPAKGALTKLHDAMEDLDHSVIEEQIGMKLLSMDQYTSMQMVLSSTKEELTNLRKWVADKEKEVKAVTKEKENIHNMVQDVKNERDDLKAKVLALQGEREGWRKEVGRIKGERDKAQKELEGIKKELESLQAKK